MADTGASWNRKPGIGPVDPNEKLFLFGYSCKIFRDDEKAIYIDQGKHLIPWMGDKSLMIDRYDVRGYLHDLKQYEPNSEVFEDPLLEEESLCDEERYRSLRSDMSDEQLYQEEELKRLRAAIAGDGAYHEIGFSYDTVENEKYIEPEQPKDFFLKRMNDFDPTGWERTPLKRTHFVFLEEPEDEPFLTPEGLEIPKGMEVPFTMKIHAIIEKTALFVSEQGGQMEIIIKMKQHANPQFAFMHLDNPLYPYYKHLVKKIKSGSYKPVQARKVSRSEDEDDDGHYLHPSLMAGKQEPVPKFTVPTINFRRSSDDSYSVLVRNLQQHRAATEPSVESPESQEISDSKANFSFDEIHNNFEDSSLALSDSHIVPPPPDLQPIIDKMAEYVVKNGEDFETIVKSKKDHRFDFLHDWHEFHNYYVYKRNSIKRQLFGNGTENSRPSNASAASQEMESSLTQRPVVQESGPVLYSKTNPPAQPPVANNPPPPVVKDEFDALYSHDSQSSICEPQAVPQEVGREDSSDSVGYDSPTVSESSKDEPRKPAKVLKGPISFSLKARDTDTPTDKAKLTTLLLDDSEDESGEEANAEKEESAKRRKSTEESLIFQQLKTNSSELKPLKPNNEFLEAKQAEERIRDKLLATARERLAQQRKEKQLLMEQQKREEQLKKDKQQLLDQQRKDKQLQLERKRKAELFLKMLKKKDPDPSAVVSHILASDKTSSNQQNSDFWRLPDTSAPAGGILFSSDKLPLSSYRYPSVIPGIKTEWSSNSNSEQSGEEEPISMIGEKLSSDPETVEPVEKPVVAKQERKKKKRKRSRSRSREHSRSSKSRSRRTRDRHRTRSRSPSRNSRHEKPKKEKQLPAAYALTTRSRSRSRSPRRYRPSFNTWNRRR